MEILTALLTILTVLWVSLWTFGYYTYPQFDVPNIYCITELFFHAGLVYLSRMYSLYLLALVQFIYSGIMFLIGYHWFLIKTGLNVFHLEWTQPPLLIRLMYIDIHVKGIIMIGVFVGLLILSLVWFCTLVIYLQDLLRGELVPFPNHYALFRSRFDRLFRCHSVPIDDCSICLTQFDQNTVTSISCGHSFHRACISKWLENSIGVCPLCHQVFQTRVHPDSKIFVHNL